MNIELMFSTSELEKIKILAELNDLDIEEYIKSLIIKDLEEEKWNLNKL